MQNLDRTKLESYVIGPIILSLSTLLLSFMSRNVVHNSHWMTVYREHRLRASKAKINLTRLDSEGVDSAKDRSCLYNSKEVTWVVWYVRKSKNNDRKKYLPSWEERSSTSAFNIALRFASKRLTVVKQKRINTVRKSESHMVFFAYHECDIDTFILGCNIGCFLTQEWFSRWIYSEKPLQDGVAKTRATPF